jgi:hypothetical protein
MAAREKLGEDRFFDVDFRTLVKDPQEMVRRIKSWHGVPHDAEGDARLDAYMKKKRGDAKGKHIYGTRRYGLDPAEIQQRYSAYIERFDIPLTDPSTIVD